MSAPDHPTFTNPVNTSSPTSNSTLHSSPSDLRKSLQLAKENLVAARKACIEVLLQFGFESTSDSKVDLEECKRRIEAYTKGKPVWEGNLDAAILSLASVRDSITGTLHILNAQHIGEINKHDTTSDAMEKGNLKTTIGMIHDLISEFERIKDEKIKAKSAEDFGDFQGLCEKFDTLIQEYGTLCNREQEKTLMDEKEELLGAYKEMLKREIREHFGKIYDRNLPDYEKEKEAFSKLPPRDVLAILNRKPKLSLVGGFLRKKIEALVEKEEAIDKIKQRRERIEQRMIWIKERLSDFESNLKTLLDAI